MGQVGGAQLKWLKRIAYHIRPLGRDAALIPQLFEKMGSCPYPAHVIFS